MRTRDGSRGDDLNDAKAAVAALLAEGAPTVGRLAARMGWSVRTLQRRLTEQGSSFSALLETVRRERALKGLRNRDLPLAELSIELGYSRQSALTRAIRRWMGASPRDMRHELSE